MILGDLFKRIAKTAKKCIQKKYFAPWIPLFEADFGNAGDNKTEEAVTQVSEESDWCGFFGFIEFD